MDVTAKQKLLLKNLKLQIKKLQVKEEQARVKMRTALKKVNKIGNTYKVRMARKMREMERKLAHKEVACYLQIARDLENQLVKGIKQKLKALNAVAKRAKSTTEKRAKRPSGKRKKRGA